MKHPKRSTDSNQRAKLIADIATGNAEENNPNEGKNKAAIELGKLGGKSRAAKLSSEKKKEIATKAAKKRWGNGSGESKIGLEK